MTRKPKSLAPPSPLEAFQRSARARTNRRTGETAQDIAKRALEAAGYIMVERVHTPWGVVRRGKRIVSAYPLEKVSGDFRAITPDGRSVLVECKCRQEPSLSLSDFAPHQIEALDEHYLHRGRTLIAWVYNGKCKLLNWAIYKPKHGEPLKWDEVQA